MLTLIPAVSVSIITIFENRYFVVFANDSKWKKYRIPMSLMNYFFAFVWSIPSFFTVPDQAIARRNTWEMLGNIPDFIRSDQIFVISFEFQYLTISCFIFCLVQVPQTFMYVTLMQRGMKKLRKTARFSEKKLKVQNNFLNAIYIQVSVFMTIIQLPIGYLFISILGSLYIQIGNNCIFLIFFTKWLGIYTGDAVDSSAISKFLSNWRSSENGKWSYIKLQLLL
ncbi:hypothetical protein CAEBREN_13432 [Caenorhabditis brenneri]|uniref:Uncharacterized protein n=1 Tax=Caenorhabditis brenneri TaxID=135651 RepID=G0M9D6_CAEBE|nr:hypothetical protein CAEBREN_13432 [Caenorhabditis brenneri]